MNDSAIEANNATFETLHEINNRKQHKSDKQQETASRQTHRNERINGKKHKTEQKKVA
jgi:hypothetical protein